MLLWRCWCNTDSKKRLDNNLFSLVSLLLIAFIYHYSQADSLCLHSVLMAGWCHMKLLLSWHILCTPYNHAPCHFMQSHLHTVHMYSAVTCHLYFWQNDWDVLHGDGMDTEISVSTESWPWWPGEDFFSFCCSWRDLNPWPFNHESGALTTDYPSSLSVTAGVF